MRGLLPTSPRTTTATCAIIEDFPGYYFIANVVKLHTVAADCYMFVSLEYIVARNLNLRNQQIYNRGIVLYFRPSSNRKREIYRVGGNDEERKQPGY